MPRAPRRILVGALVAVSLGGCAGISPSQLGQTVGTIAGSAIVPGAGAPLGALVGLLAGLLVQGKVDQVTETRERKELGDQLAVNTGSAPSDAITPPLGEPVRVWVDETVRDGRLFAGHFDTRHIP